MDTMVQDHGTCVVCVRECVHVSACVCFLSVCVPYAKSFDGFFWGSLSIAVLGLVWIR